MKFKYLLFFSLLVASLQAASVADLTFTLNGDGTEYSVSDCLETASGSLDIPSTYNGLPVTSIRNFAFYVRSSLTSVTIPDSVTSIGDGAFNGCSSLTSIAIPNSVTSIGDGAFAACSSLTSVTIPNSVTSIGYGTFESCSSLTSIAIPNSVTSIGGSAFNGCSSLTSIAIPDSVTSIGSRVFDGSGISFLEDTNSIKYLISASGNTAYLINGSSASGNVVLPNTLFGASVSLIGDSAFESCSSLTSIAIPNSVTSIGYYAFNGCSSLTSIAIPNSVTSIGGSAFAACSSLTSVTIPNSVTSIGYGTFESCSSLTSIAIPNSVTSIGGSAFAACSSLTSVTIPDSVTSIGDGAFNGCSSLTSIAIPNSVTSIGRDAFGGSDYGYSINTITLPYKFAGSAGLFGIPGDAEITVNFDDVSEGLLANTNFVAGISEEVTFDSSAVDQAIADEAQARADADVILQANIDNNDITQEAGREFLRIYVDSALASMQSYVDSAVAQARAEGVTAGIQSVTSSPQSYQLYSESSIMEMNVSNPTLSMLNESEQALVEFTLETSTDLEDWNIEERIQRTVQATGDKFFVRIKSGVPYVTPNVLVFNHPSYGEILTDQSGNVLYGFSIDSVGGDPLYSGSNWPLAPQITDPEPDVDVTAALTSGTFSNTSGGPWLKVNNRPVYTYAGDSEPNQASGHGLGSVWFTIKPDGTLNQ